MPSVPENSVTLCKLVSCHTGTRSVSVVLERKNREVHLSLEETLDISIDGEASKTVILVGTRNTHQTNNT